MQTPIAKQSVLLQQQIREVEQLSFAPCQQHLTDIFCILPAFCMNSLEHMSLNAFWQMSFSSSRQVPQAVQLVHREE